MSKAFAPAALSWGVPGLWYDTAVTQPAMRRPPKPQVVRLLRVLALLQLLIPWRQLLWARQLPGPALHQLLLVHLLALPPRVLPWLQLLRARQLPSPPLQQLLLVLQARF